MEKIALPFTIRVVIAALGLISFADAASQQLQFIKIDVWDGVSGTWNNNRYRFIDYDDNGNIVHCIDKTPNESGWKIFYEEFRTNDAQGRIASIDNYYRYAFSPVDIYYHITFSYDAKGRLSSCITQNYFPETDTYSNYERLTYEYDSSGFLLSALTEWPSAETGEWQLSQRLLFTSNGSGITDDLQGDSIYPTSRAFTNYSFDDYLYNWNSTAGAVSSELHQEWRSDNSWETIASYVFEHDSEGRIESIYGDEVPMAGQPLEPHDRIFKYFDDEGRLSHQRRAGFNNTTWTEEVDTYNPGGNLQEQLFYNGSAGPYTNYQSRILYNYETLGTTSAQPQAVYSVFPNPAFDRITVSGNAISEKHYKLTDVNGRIVAEGQISGNVDHVDLDKLAKGLYFLKVGDMAAKKIIKE